MPLEGLYASLGERMLGLLYQTDPAAIECRPELRNATLPIINNTAGQLLGIASPLATAIVVILVVCVIALSFSKMVPRFLKAIAICVGAVIVLFSIPDIINAFAGSC